MKPLALIISCEHGGNELPADYRQLFNGHEALLQTHRGWDPGALQLARQMAAALDAPLFSSTTTRLLIDLNRSIGHKTLHSEVSRGLTQAARREVVRVHYHPHRDAIQTEVDKLIAQGSQVIHIASHSFTPELYGIVRPDIAWCYDSRRTTEGPFIARWLAATRRRRPDLTLRRNFPYQGKLDGLTGMLRKRHGSDDYIGTEIEINQRFVHDGGRKWDQLREDVIGALVDVLVEANDNPLLNSSLHRHKTTNEVKFD